MYIFQTEKDIHYWKIVWSDNNVLILEYLDNGLLFG